MSVREAIESGDLNAQPTSIRSISPELAVAVHPDPAPAWIPDLHQVIVTKRERIVELRDYRSREEALSALEASW